MNNLWSHKYVERAKKFIMGIFGTYHYTIADLLVFYLMFKVESIWYCGFAVIWILFISPILVAAKEDLDKSKLKDQDEHTQL